MKKLFSRRWHRIPVALVSALLILTLVAGGVFASGYGFFKSALQVQVEEAIVVAMYPDWDNLESYGSVDDVEIALSEIDGLPAISITTIEGYAGAGFVAGEYIVIPVNFRNAGDGELTLGAIVNSENSGGLSLDCIWQENTGGIDPITEESGQQLCRGFVASGTWGTLDGWAGAIDGKGGKSGSAVIGAQVLFVKLSAPGDIVPTEGESYTLIVTFTRGG